MWTDINVWTRIDESQHEPRLSHWEWIKVWFSISANESEIENCSIPIPVNYSLVATINATECQRPYQSNWSIKFSKPAWQIIQLQWSTQSQFNSWLHSIHYDQMHSKHNFVFFAYYFVYRVDYYYYYYCFCCCCCYSFLFNVWSTNSHDSKPNWKIFIILIAQSQQSLCKVSHLNISQPIFFSVSFSYVYFFFDSLGAFVCV